MLGEYMPMNSLYGPSLPQETKKEEKMKSGIRHHFDEIVKAQTLSSTDQSRLKINDR